MKQCLLIGLTCMILKIAFQRAAIVCKKQCICVGLTCIALDVAFQRVDFG